MNEFNINIIGYGFVGKAVGNLMIKNKVNFNVYDILDGTSLDTIIKFEKDNSLNVYFICVPTPPMVSGDCDISVVESVINDLSKLVTKESVVVIKSTIKPGTTKKLSEKFKNIQVVFCPEFLREISANEDMYNTNFALCGTVCKEIEETLVHLFKNVLYMHNPNFKCYIKTPEECELFKYTVNTFLAVKVWYFNEIHCLCEKMNIDYQEFKTLFPLDPRIGEYGTTVPNNGNFGFSGSCLPKEIRAMTQVQRDLDIPNSVLQEIIKRNNIFLEK